MSEQHSERSERERRIDEAVAQWYQALEAGQPLEREAFLANHPDLAGELASFLDARSAFEHKAGAPADATLGCSEGTGGSSQLGTVRYFGDYDLVEEIARGGMGVV